MFKVRVLVRTILVGLVLAAVSTSGSWNCERVFAQEEPKLEIAHRGLHGYIGSRAGSTPDTHRYGAGFYASVWPLIGEPIRNFQIGLPSTWLTPDNSDNRTEPLCPPGTIARDHWPERGPTYGSVFQTVEGGLGYWAGNRFHYGPPKFSMNATPNCYSTEVASPGWPFFHSSHPLPDDMLGIAQLSNRLLVPPDGMPFAGNPSGELLGYAYMALPLTDPRDDPQPTGEHSWTLFLDAENFKGPLAYYIPECWSRISRDYPFNHGRGLDSRPTAGGIAGSMEINTVPEFRFTDKDGTIFTKIPQLQFPVDASGRTVLVRDVKMYSKSALFDDVLRWRQGGPPASGVFNEEGAVRPKITTRPVTYRQDKKKITGINQLAEPTVFPGDVFGLKWTDREVIESGFARFPTYFRDEGETRACISAADVPADSGLIEARFPSPTAIPQPYTAEPLDGSWIKPGPVSIYSEVKLVDRSTVRYSWYRFIDQPVFQQFDWTEEQRNQLQEMVEKIHRHWKIDGTYLSGPGEGKLASFSPGLFVTPPKGKEVGYVPIVHWQGILEEEFRSKE